MLSYPLKLVDGAQSQKKIEYAFFCDSDIEDEYHILFICNNSKKQINTQLLCL
jgi:hypothetical protein